ncbi:MAG: hypothetical protein A3K67_01115 [Euryarchaeota archaeon RBG_16_62_10]|nr:MAG: hypothetical protein A3K67_01115 [Euryarchaeota archaeon RBG_16_62_10]
MTTLKDHMMNILRSREFAVEERDGYLYGSRDDVSVVVLAASDMLIEDVQDFIRNVRGFSGRKIVASLGKVDDSVQSFLQRNNVHYWGREEIEHELGNLQLETVTDDRGKSLFDEIVSDELPQRPAEPPEQAIPVIVESSEEKAERIVKPNFSLEDVKYLARHEVQGYKYELELVPHYLFHFVLDLEDGKQRAGIAAVNALTSHVETWRWGFELVDSIDLPHSKREPKIDFEKARQMANDLIAKEYKAHVETVRDFGHSEIIERKKAGKGSVTIEPKGLVYLPVWCVEGTRGAMIVNSSSGKIISEHMHGGGNSAETRQG